MNRPTIIFTDLDGTLLDPLTYSYDAASPALERVRALQIPLVIVSSKTRAEIEVCRRRLHNTHPFISENGGGIFIPKGYFPFPVPGEEREGYLVQGLGVPYAESRRRLIGLRRRTGIAVRGFGDMEPREVAALTGLSESEAALAKQRDFSEPFVFPDRPDDRFLRAIESAGLAWTRGRLFHIMGNHDKGRAVAMVRGLYERQMGGVRTIGLGDGLNDLPFLRVVDRPVLVRHEDGRYEEGIDVPGLMVTAGSGPEGWNEAVNGLLDEE